MRRIVLLGLMVLTCMTLCSCSDAQSENQDVNHRPENETNDENKDETSYIFTYEGVDVSVNEDISAVLAKLGDPVSYYEAASCAFEGLDKIYTYASFQIDTYPIDGVDMLASIYFLDDLVETPEGVCLYMTKADMIEAYGEPTSVNGTEYVYEKGNGTLRFIIDGDEIISIEYRTKVEYK